MGCTNCGGKVGCDHRKTAMIGEVDRVLASIYPTSTWGEPRELTGGDWAGGHVAERVAAIAEHVAEHLVAATFVRSGDDTEPCDYIYALCLGRVPCLVQVRDHGIATPSEWTQPPRESHAGDTADRFLVSAIHELYLRVVISHRAPIAAVQQVAVTLERDPGQTHAGWVIRESPRAGVYDPPLLPRMQKLVAVLQAHDLVHVDFGEIAHPPPGFHPGRWRERFGLERADPAIANYLFYPHPTTMITSTLIAPDPRS